MGKKQIDTERIKSSQANLDYFHDPNVSGESILTQVMDDSSELIFSGIEIIESTTDKVVTATKSLNDYLNSVADDFKDMDIQLQQKVEESTQNMVASGSNPFEVHVI